MFYFFGFFLTFPLYITFPELSFFLVSNLSRQVTIFSDVLFFPASVIPMLCLLLLASVRRREYSSRFFIVFLMSVFITFDLGLIFSFFLSFVLSAIFNLKFFYSAFSLSESKAIFLGALGSLVFLGVGTLFDFLRSSFPELNLLYGTNSSFGFEVYAFYVSYSAVVSLFLLLLIFEFSTNQAMGKIVCFLAVIFLEVSLFASSRRAAFVEAFFIAAIFLLGSINLRRLRLSSRSFKIFFPFLLHVFLFGVWLVIVRPFSVDDLVLSRSSSNQSFLSMLRRMDVEQFLFGFERGGFGGYSNLGIDLFVRLGFLGAVFYFSMILIGFLRSDILWRGRRRQSGILRIYTIFFFVLLVGNVANLNLSQPFYISSLIGALFFINFYSIGLRYDSRL